MVNRQMLVRKKLIILAFQKACLTDTSNLGGNLEQAVCHLTGDHVDFINLCDRNDQIRVIRPCLAQYVRIGRMADDALHIQRVQGVPNQPFIQVDDGDVRVKLA